MANSPPGGFWLLFAFRSRKNEDVRPQLVFSTRGLVKFCPAQWAAFHLIIKEQHLGGGRVGWSARSSRLCMWNLIKLRIHIWRISELEYIYLISSKKRALGAYFMSLVLCFGGQGGEGRGWGGGGGGGWSGRGKGCIIEEWRLIFPHATRIKGF